MSLVTVTVSSYIGADGLTVGNGYKIRLSVVLNDTGWSERGAIILAGVQINAPFSELLLALPNRAWFGF